jgi:hypothetical protein
MVRHQAALASGKLTRVTSGVNLPPSEVIMSRLIMRKRVPSPPKQQNPYAMAVFTAVLAGIFSIAGSYFTTQLQTRSAIVQKQLEYRAQAYSGFLEKIDRSRSPVLSQLLSIGSLAERVVTDSEVQSLEDRLADIFKQSDIQDLYWQLNSDLNILRLHGSTRVRRMCEDILKALSLQDSEIDWSFYSAEASLFYTKWRDAQKQGQPYGWKPKISKDERLMIVVVGKLFELLIDELRHELQIESST